MKASWGQAIKIPLVLVLLGLGFLLLGGTITWSRSDALGGRVALESALASTTGTAQSGVLTHSEVGDFGQQRSRDLPQEGTNVPLLINEGVHRKEKEVDLDEALAMLAHCRTIDCIGAAHAAINGRTRFNAPHFFLIGFQKCATTSMVRHLDKHPQFLSSYIKEPHWWFICQKDLAAGMCKPNSTEDYISNYLRIQTAAEMRLEAATADTSADYAMRGEFVAKRVHAAFPWLKIVIMMREPISRVISHTRMWTEKFDPARGCEEDESAYDCIRPYFDPGEEYGHYAESLEAWLDTFPSEQIHVVQFEELQEDTEAVLRRLKVFLGMDPNLPQMELRNVNSRAVGGYPIEKAQYEELVTAVQPDVAQVGRLLRKYGLGDADAFVGRWKAVWESRLATCSQDMCTIDSN